MKIPVEKLLKIGLGESHVFLLDRGDQFAGYRQVYYVNKKYLPSTERLSCVMTEIEGNKIEFTVTRTLCQPQETSSSSTLQQGN